MPKQQFAHLTAIVWLALATASVGGDVVTLGENLTGPTTGFPHGSEPGSISLWFARQPGAANQVLFVYGQTQKGPTTKEWSPGVRRP